MSEQSSRDERRAKWNAGIELTFAFMHFGSERQRQQQIERRGTPHAQVIEDLMTSDIFGMLASAELVAWGFRIAPTLSDGPIEVPADVFDQAPPDTWRDNLVSASGETYERITISRRGDSGTEQGQASATSALPIPRTPALTPPVDKGGRRDTYALSRTVLLALAAENEGLIGLSAESLHPTFAEKYRDLHSMVAKLKPPPEARTLRTHLKRFRAEWPGNNRQ